VTRLAYQERQHLRPIARVGDPPPPGVVAALGRFEDRRLLRHPVFIAGVGLSVLFMATQRDVDPVEAGQAYLSTAVGQAYFNLMGWGVLPLALATLICLNLAAGRSRRHGTDELYDSLPVHAPARTAACLLASSVALAIGAALIGAAYLYLGAGDGLLVDYDNRTAVPSVFELAQGPLLVAVLGVVGVALATWRPRAGLTFAVVFALLLSEVLLVFWTISQSSLRWLLPFGSSATFTRHGASFPPANSSESGLAGFDVAASGWHLLYLAALGLGLAAVCLLRDAPRRRLLVVAGAALLLLAATAALQLWAAA